MLAATITVELRDACVCLRAINLASGSFGYAHADCGGGTMVVMPSGFGRVRFWCQHCAYVSLPLGCLEVRNALGMLVGTGLQAAVYERSGSEALTLIPMRTAYRSFFVD